MHLPLNFITLNRAASAVSAALFLVLLLAPSIVWQLFSINGNPETDFLARRAAMLFLGLAIITWQAALSGELAMRRAVSCALSVTMACLALAGLAEYARGFAGPGILTAAAVEASFALLYAHYWRSPGTL